MKLMAVQEEYAPNSICFGCGPANEKGLKIKSYRNNFIIAFLILVIFLLLVF